MVLMVDVGVVLEVCELCVMMKGVVVMVVVVVMIVVVIPETGCW